jgi:hypothetical protein
MDHIVEHQGSRYDVGFYNPSPGPRPTNWVIHPKYFEESLKIRDTLGDDAVLYLGLAPLPESSVGSGFATARDQMLIRLNEYLGADILFTNLPPTLPNGFCANEVHLNQRGAEHFTRLLAAELENSLWPALEKKP